MIMKKRILAIFSAGLTVLSGSGLAYAYQYKLKTLPITQYFTSGYTNSVWDWAGPAGYENKTDLTRLADFLYLHQINTVYVDVSGASAFNENNLMPELQQSLSGYVSALKRRNIRVYSAAGDVDWSKPESRSKPLSVTDFVFNYNAKYPKAKLSGLEFDIESYNQKSFPAGSNTEKSLILTEYLDAVSELATRVESYNNSAQDKLDIGFAVPYWFDNENGNIPSVTWESRTGPTIYHLIDLLQRRGGGNIVVMAYRNAATGNDGTIFHSRTEVDYAQAKTTNVKVLIGQELNSVEPAKITFYGRTTAELSNEVKSITDEFKSNTTAYGGIALNDLDGLRLLDKNR
jgi:hypothetical protein